FGSIRSHDIKRIDRAPSSAAYVDGNLVFARDGMLVHAPFDPVSGKMGVAVPTDQHVDWDPSTGLALFDVSESGTLVCRESNAITQTRLVWFDRTGAPVDTLGMPAAYRQISVARDGKSAAVSIGNPNGDGDIWLID